MKDRSASNSNSRSSADRPSAKKPNIQRVAFPAPAIQRENLDGNPMKPDGSVINVGDSVGNWRLTGCGDRADLWEHSGGQWKGSYWRVSGDYHIKGKSGGRRDYEKGKFNGSVRTTGGDANSNSAERDTIYTSFQSDVIGGVSGYSL